MEDGEASKGGRKIDPGRKYGVCVGKNNNAWKCIYFFDVYNGGVTRLKEHLVGGMGNAKKYPLAPAYVVKELQDYMIHKLNERNVSQMAYEAQVGDAYDEEDEEDAEEPPSRASQVKKRKTKGSLDRYVTVPPKDILQGRKDRKGIFGAIDKEERLKVCLGIVWWFCDASLPFNVVNNPSYFEMIELIGLYGPGLKPPSMYELREPLLKKVKEQVGEKIMENKREWAEKGCLLMLDGWRDMMSRKEIVNFLINSPKGSVFIKYMDVREVVKD